MSKEEQTTIQDRGTDTVSPAVAQAVSEAINGQGGVEQLKECAAQKPKQKRWISQQEILLIAARVAAVIDEELNEVKKAGVMVDEDDRAKLLSALVNT